MSTPLVHCYVYYRIAPQRASAAREALGAVFRALEERAGIVGRLLARQDDPWLWMEVYENIADRERFEAMLEDLVNAHRFAACLEPGSVRKTERFVAILGALATDSAAASR